MQQNYSAIPPRLAVVIATCRRDTLLFERCLPSIANQKRQPELVLVVDDGRDDDGLCLRVEAWGAAHRINISVLANQRTPGASGAWNTAIYALASDKSGLGPWQVAFLDDDDAWLPDHLDEVASAFDDSALWCATGFERVTQKGRRPISPPERVSPEAFLVGNPGIQGSNLAAELELLQLAGGFDEALAACTDRDLCIRLSRLAGDRYRARSSVTVRHFACEDRQRLSSFGDSRRLAGLAAFERKHSPLMAPMTLKAFRERAERYFGYRPSEAEYAKPVPSPGVLSALTDKPRASCPLTIGFIADRSRGAEVGYLLSDIKRLNSQCQSASVEVLVLSNGWEDEERRSLAEMVEQCRKDGLGVYLLHADEILSFSTDRLAIAEARNLLQASLYRLAKQRPAGAVWILDDDMRLDPLVLTQTGLDRERSDVFAAIYDMRARGIDIGIGQYTGAPPLPFLTTMRLQLLDFVWNVRRLEAMAPETPLSDLPTDGGPDFYHDLSSVRSDHLETARPVVPAHEGETVAAALRRVLGQACSVLTGSFPTRHLFMGAHEPQALHRGGNTLVLDVEALRDTPNLSPIVDGRSTRRADMIWAWQQDVAAGRKIEPIKLGVFHDRSHIEFCERAAVTAIVDDIRGHVVHACLRDRASACAAANTEDLVSHYLGLRCRQLRGSLKRIEGLMQELKIWRRQTCEHSDNLRDVDILIARLESLLRPELYEEIEEAAGMLTSQIVGDFETQLDASRQRHKAWVDEACSIDSCLETSRTANAKARLLECGKQAPASTIEWLGSGEEGVVFTDSSVVYKVLDRVRPEEVDPMLSALSSLGRGVDVNSPLHAVDVLRLDSCKPVISYPFEPSAPYKGGFGPGLIELLVACHRQQIVCRNIHPKNLRTAGQRVLLIDYGRDIVRIDDRLGTGDEFIRMCRRAYISWRWAWRDDLEALLRASLNEDKLPELEGFDRFLEAVHQRAGLTAPRDPVMDRAISLSPARVLDFGCGKGEQAKRLHEAGIEVVGYDPDASLASRFVKSNIQFVADIDDVISRGPFDLIICRRVACTLENNAFKELLESLRQAVSTKGRVLFAVCHPVYAPTCVTPEAAPVCATGASDPIWRKRFHATGSIRTEVHRHERKLRRAIHRSGFRIAARHERETVDLERFEPIADLLVLELEPAPAPDVTLMIKACAMDAHEIDDLVRHQVRAIEVDGALSEILLVLDERTEGFARPYAEPDLALLIEKADRLQNEGWVDRIVHSSSGDPVEALNERWFGLKRADRHAGNGAQLAATFRGFEACRTRYVLHLDSDLMIGRVNSERSTLANMLKAMTLDACAVTAAFPIARSAQVAWSSSCNSEAWRVESRGGLIDLDRLRNLEPLPAHYDAPLPTWHRALDERIQDGIAHSLRGSSGSSFFVHPPNKFKCDAENWALVRDRIARGVCPPAQAGQVEWDGSIDGWMPAERHEPVILLIGGRNVAPSRMRRCLQSLKVQSFTQWGAIVMDDASDFLISEELDWLCSQMGERVSVLRREKRYGLLSNMDLAIRQLCGNDASIIITLDLDDALIGEDALATVVQQYVDGADLTVGTMLRTDKPAPGPADFAHPRHARGGQVWQHLRSFRKHLWYQIPEAYLKLNGNFVDLANDWAYMLALCELASSPVCINTPLYLHEPSGDRGTADRAAREKIIERICSLPTLNKHDSGLTPVEAPE